jgi:hypothetical protein
MFTKSLFLDQKQYFFTSVVQRENTLKRSAIADQAFLAIMYKSVVT